MTGGSLALVHSNNPGVVLSGAALRGALVDSLIGSFRGASTSNPREYREAKPEGEGKVHGGPNRQLEPGGYVESKGVGELKVEWELGGRGVQVREAGEAKGQEEPKEVGEPEGEPE